MPADARLILAATLAVSVAGGQLGHAPVQEVVGAMLVHRNRPEVVVRVDDLADELLDVVRLAREHRHGHVQRLEQRAKLGRGDREVGLRDRTPLLQPVHRDPLEALDVELPGADLDARLGAPREDVDLLALLHLRRGERVEAPLGVTEVVAERPPLPARDDHPASGAGAGRPWPERRSTALASSTSTR